MWYLMFYRGYDEPQVLAVSDQKTLLVAEAIEHKPVSREEEGGLYECDVSVFINGPGGVVTKLHDGSGSFSSDVYYFIRETKVL